MKYMKRFFVVFLCAGISGAALLHVSQLVEHAEGDLAKIERSIAQEEEHQRVLKAEWSYLNRPQNLEILAEEYLDLSPPGAHKTTEPLMGVSSDLPPAAPVLNGEMPLQPVFLNSQEEP